MLYVCYGSNVSSNRIQSKMKDYHKKDLHT